MLNESVLKGLFRFFRLCNFLNASPIYWNSVTNVFQEGSWLRTTLYVPHLLWYFLNSLSMTLRLVDVYLYGRTMKPEVIFFQLVYVVWYPYLTASAFTLLYQRREVINFVNSMLRVNKLLAEETGCADAERASGQKSGVNLEKTLQILTPSCVTGSLFTSSLMLWDPQSPIVLYARIPERWQSPWLFATVYAWQAYTFAVSYVLVMFWWFILLAYCQCIFSWIYILSQNSDLPTKIQTYRMLQVLHSLYESLFRHRFTRNFKFFSVLAFALVTYTAVTMADKLHPVAYTAYLLLQFMMIIIMITTCTSLSQVHEASVWFVRGCVTSRGGSGQPVHQLSSYCRRLVASMRPIGICIGYLYVMKGSTTLSVVRITVDLTVNMLIMRTSHRV